METQARLKLISNCMSLIQGDIQPVQNYPPNWEESIVYVLTFTDKSGKAFEKTPILAASPDLGWVKDKFNYYEPIFASVLTESPVSLKIFQMVGKDKHPFRAEEMEDLKDIRDNILKDLDLVTEKLAAAAKVYERYRMQRVELQDRLQILDRGRA